MMQVDGPESIGADEEGLPKFGSSTCEDFCTRGTGVRAQLTSTGVIRPPFLQTSGSYAAWLTVENWLL